MKWYVFLLPIALIVALCVLIILMWQATPSPASAPSTARSAVSLGGPFVLTDSHGTQRRSEDFLGKYQLIYFGYSFCPDVCPTDLSKLSDILAALGEQASEVNVLFITVDPERDTVAHLARYMENFDPRITALTGSMQETETAKRAYKVYSAKAKPDGTSADYLVDHSAFIYLMDRQGRYRTHFSHGMKTEEILAQLRHTLAESE